MPRNDQISRQWRLLRLLESPTGKTLQELAAALPDDVPKNLRTTRRDIEALEHDFPLVNERVDGRTVWKLMDGYRNLPKIAFSPTELMALTLSRSLLKPLEGTELRQAIDSALTKAAIALPDEGRTFVQRMEGFFSVGIGPHKDYRAQRETVDTLSRAVTQSRTVQMRYASVSRGKTTRREVDPYRLWYAAGGLYLIAFCHERRDVLVFAVDRIRSLTVTDHPFQMALGFDFDAYTVDALRVWRGKPVTVELVFDKKTAAWAWEMVWHPSQSRRLLRDGRMRLTLKISDTPELVSWILSFGSGVRVVKPESLREKVREEAKKIFRQA